MGQGRSGSAAWLAVEAVPLRGHQAAGVGEVDRVVEAVAVAVQGAGVSRAAEDFVLLQEAAGTRIVGPGAEEELVRGGVLLFAGYPLQMSDLILIFELDNCQKLGYNGLTEQCSATNNYDRDLKHQP
jgi:hypothetical protein